MTGTRQQPLWARDAAAARRVQALCDTLSLTEKVALLSNQQTEHPALDIVRAADGAGGIRLVPQVTDSTSSTALPAPVALAATWDTGMAREYGRVLGRELRATGHHVLLGPAVDIARVPLGGRIYESFGEDPTLAARIVTPEIGAVQAAGGQACIKHFLVNNQERSRAVVDVHVDETTLREIYLPPFEAAVRAGVTTVMSSYNKVRGEYASHSRDLITGILRDEWEFPGWVMSDYLATHELQASWDAGLDWELTDDPVWGRHLIEAVETGRISMSEIDERVARVLTPYFGLQQDRLATPLTPSERIEHHQIAREVAARGTVLLTNDGVLPLAPTTARIAVIGPDANGISASGGGSPFVRGNADLAVSIVDGLRTALPEATVRWASGVDPISSGVLLPGPAAIPSGFLTADDAELGVAVDFWDNTAFDGAPAWSGRLAQIEMNRGYFAEPGFHAPSDAWTPWPSDVPYRHSSRWQTRLHAPVTGEYELALTWLGSARLIVDGRTLLDVSTAVDPRRHIPGGILWDGIGAQVETVRVHLDAGQTVPVVVEYATTLPEQSGHYGAQLRLGWVPPAEVVAPRVSEATELAAEADVAIVVVRAYESEAMDRPTTRLPQGQDALINAVASTGTPTVAITMSGGPIDVSTWKGNVAAHLHAWYPGEAQGTALADLLTGVRDPSGRLPLTFPHAEVRAEDYPPATYPGVGKRVEYGERTAVGYRSEVQAAYAFGYGLSYATHAVTDVAVTTGPEGRAAIEATVRNSSTRPGSEVLQAYRGDGAGRAVALLGWARVTTTPGEAARCQIDIDIDDSHHRWNRWNGAQHRWEAIEGDIELLLSTSAIHHRARARAQARWDDGRLTLCNVVVAEPTQETTS